MEGVPRIPMLSFPLRRSADTPQFKARLQKFISHHYNESPDSYNAEIHELETLRASAIHASRDYSGCATLKKYFCQLNFMKTRFPLHEGSPISVTFSWFDVYSEQVHGWSDIDFELSCILYNIGALHTVLAGAISRSTVDDMKNCVTHFQCAAWAFQFLRHTYPKFFTPDISPDVLAIMTNVCLAQAQECVLEKSFIDNRKSSITAKVVLQIVEYYQSTLGTCDQLLKDSNQYSDKVVKAVKNWRKLIELKISYYWSLTYLYRGQQAEDEQKWGERVTFYKAAQEKLDICTKALKGFEKTDPIHDTMAFTQDVVAGKLAVSLKDNEFIYHEKVPELNGIREEIKGVPLVKPIQFRIDDPEVAGPDIFGRLVPMEAHEASSLYSEEKAKLLRTYTAKIEERNEILENFLSALQLEHLDLHSNEMKIPQELVDCCASLSVNKDAVKDLIELMSTLSGLYHDVDSNIKEIGQLLNGQEAKEAEYVKIMGKRAPSNLVADLTHQCNKYEKAHLLASKSNQALHDALTLHVKNMNILMQPLDEVLKHIPSASDLSSKDDSSIQEMRRLAAKVDEMRTQRTQLERQLRDSIHSDDITKQLVVKQDQDLDVVFQEELRKHEKITQIIDQNLLAQENIIRALTEANARYSETRQATVEVLRNRNKVIQSFLNSFDAYDELQVKCRDGIEFYKKLDENVTQLLNKVRGVCKVEDEERELKLTAKNKRSPAFNPNSANPVIYNQFNPDSMDTSMSMLPDPPSHHPKLKDYLNKGKLAQKIPNTPQAASGYSAQGYPTQGYGNQPAVPGYAAQTGAGAQSFGTQPGTSTQNYTPHPVPGLQNYGSVSSPASGIPGSSLQTYNSQPPTGLQNYPPQSTTGAQGYSTQPVPSAQNYAGQPTAVQSFAAPPVSGTQSYPGPSASAGQTYTAQTASSVGMFSAATATGSQGYAQQIPAVAQGQSYASQQPSSGAPFSYGAAGTSRNQVVGQQAHTNSISRTAYPSQGQNNSYSHGYPNPTPANLSQGQNQSFSSAPTGHSSYYSYNNSGTPSQVTPSPASTQQYPYYTLQQQQPGQQQASAQQPAQQQPGHHQQYPGQMPQPAYQQQQSGQMQQPGHQQVQQPGQQPGPQQLQQPEQQHVQQPGQQQVQQLAGQQQVQQLPGKQQVQQLPGQQQVQQPGQQQFQQPGSLQMQQPGSQQVQQPGSQQVQQPGQQQFQQPGSQQVQQPGQQSSAIPPIYQPQPAVTQAIAQPSYNFPSSGAIQFHGAATAAPINRSNVITQAAYPTTGPIKSYLTGFSQGQNQSFSTPSSNVNSYYTYNNQVTPSLVTPSVNQQYQYGYTSPQQQYQQPQSQQPNQGQPQQQQQPYQIQPQQQQPSGYPQQQQQTSIPASGVAAPQPGQYYYGNQNQQQYQTANPPQSQQSAQQQPPVPDGTLSSSSSHPLQTIYYSNQPSRSVSSAILPKSDTQLPTPAPAVRTNVDLLSDLELSSPSMTPTLAPVVLHGTNATSDVGTTNSGQNNPPQSQPQQPEEIPMDQSKPGKTESSDLPEDIVSVVKKVSNNGIAKKKKVDPYSDPNLLEKFAHEVEKLAHTIEAFDKKSLNGPTNLDLKWKELLDIQNAEGVKKTISVARCYPMKNRYPDILPFDQSRVPLPCTKDDYINASFLSKLSQSGMPHIVTQAPLPGTYSDFWHMIWLYSVELIACLSSDVDLKGHIYWPETKAAPMCVGPFKISLQTCNSKPTFVERIFSVTNSDLKQSRVVIQLQFKEWIGNAFPVSPGPLLGFVNEVLSFYEQQRNLTRPVIVHCLPGVGKTGVFSVLAAAVQEINSGNAIMDLVVCAGTASEEVKGIMIDKEYLRFTYHCLLYYCQDILMKRGILSSKPSFAEKPKLNTTKHTRHPSQDFLDDPFKKLLVKTELKVEAAEDPVKPFESPVTSSCSTPPVMASASSTSSTENSRRNSLTASPLRQPKIYADLPAALTNLDPSTFRIVSKEKEASASELKSIVREAFESGKGALLERKLDNPDDPLSSLDPLWTIKK